MYNTTLPELDVMQKIADAVTGLTLTEKKRVAAWFNEYATDEDSRTATVSDAGYADDADVFAEEDSYAAEVEEAERPTGIDAYYDFSALYDDVAPKTGAQKAVVAGYWLQFKVGQESWKASEVNKLLKSIDVKVSSISIVLSNAVKSNKTMVTQLERLGDSERSRKTFCLNEAGIAYVEERMQ